MKSTPVIDRLIDEVRQAAASDANQPARRALAPQITIGVEEPTVSAILFGCDANRYYSDPLYYVEQCLRQKLWRWRNIEDDTPITTDISATLGYYPEYTFLGMSVSFDAKGIPTIQEDHPISQQPDLALLEPVDFHTSGWMPRALRRFDDINAIVGGRLEVGFITWWRGCLDLAVQLRGYLNLVTDAMERPAFLHELLTFITEQRMSWHDQCCRHFGQKLGRTAIGDDWVNVPFITPTMFAEFVLPRYLDLERHHGGIASLHSCGNQTPIQHDLLRIKSLGTLEVGPWTDLEETLGNVPPERGLFIDRHPNELVVLDAAQMRAKLEMIARLCRGRRFAVKAGSHPISGEEEYLQRVRTWTRIAREVLRPG